MRGRGPHGIPGRGIACRDDEGDGGFDLADDPCPSTPFVATRTVVVPAGGARPGRAVVGARLDGVTLDLTGASPLLTFGVGSNTIYSGRPTLRGRRKAYRLATPDGVLRTLIVGTNPRKNRTKVRAVLVGATVTATACARCRR